MVDCCIGEIRLFAGAYAPRGWAPCNGSLLLIAQNHALFSVIGSVWGGDGEKTFALPDLRGRVPIGSGEGPGLTGRWPGQTGGTEHVTLDGKNFPPHQHAFLGSTAPATSAVPGPKVVFAKAASPATPAPPKGLPYVADKTGLEQRLLADDTLGLSSNGPKDSCTPHNNCMPTLNLMFIIALTGSYPFFG
ncbi:phage tail protein [Ancylobacter sp.]|uniref:phage tail protein n=1 Tax=Ancylobacter sp. TaxID=1872567 RepID=UPI003BAA328C